MSKKTCSYNFNGEKLTGNTDEECAKLKARYDKIISKKKAQMDSLKSNGITGKRKETPKPNKTNKTKKKIKKKLTALQKLFKAKLEKRKALKKQKRQLDSIRGQKRRGFDGKWN